MFVCLTRSCDRSIRRAGPRMCDDGTFSLRSLLLLNPIPRSHMLFASLLQRLLHNTATLVERQRERHTHTPQTETLHQRAEPHVVWHTAASPTPSKRRGKARVVVVVASHTKLGRRERAAETRPRARRRAASPAACSERNKKNDAAARASTCVYSFATEAQYATDH